MIARSSQAVAVAADFKHYFMDFYLKWKSFTYAYNFVW